MGDDARGLRRPSDGELEQSRHGVAVAADASTEWARCDRPPLDAAFGISGNRMAVQPIEHPLDGLNLGVRTGEKCRDQNRVELVKVGVTGIVWVLIFSCVAQADAQWQRLDGFLTDQVQAGWWSPEERMLVLGHLEASGFPTAPEEAWAIQGLSEAAAEALMVHPAWSALVQRGQQTTGDEAQTGCEFRMGTGSIRRSVRLRNPGKWAWRWDADAAMSGYMQWKSSAGKWSGLVGGHRVGWGQRLLVEEGALFNGLDEPSFALPVHYAFTPVWAGAEGAPRNGIVVNHTGAIQAALSLHNRGRDVAATVLNTTQRTGAVVRWNAEGGTGATWFAQGFGGHRHWMVEAGRVQEGLAARASCQWTPNRREEGRIQLMLRHSTQAGSLSWNAAAGGQWFDPEQRLRLRWQTTWDSEGLAHPMWLKCRKEWSRGKSVEVHWRMAPSKHSAGHHLKRLEFRGQWKTDAVSARLVWVPFLDARCPGACTWSMSLRNETWRCRYAVSVWSMPTGRRAYIPEPSLAGSTYRLLSESGHRWALALERKVEPALDVRCLVSRSDVPLPLLPDTDMLTPTYAQSQVQLSIRLNM